MSSVYPRVGWTTLKGKIGMLSLSVQYDEADTYYKIQASDGMVHFECLLPKTDPASADQTDFEDNYKAGANKPSGIKSSPFAASRYSYDGDGPDMVTVQPDEDIAICFKLEHGDRSLNGGTCFITNAQEGDWCEQMIVDKDNILGYGQDVVLRQWVKRKWIHPGFPRHCETCYAGTVLDGLYLVYVYHATAQGSARNVYLDYALHEKL